LRPIEEQGYIVPAFNTGTTDYVDCARTLTKTLLKHNPHARVCLLTNMTDAADCNLFAYTHVVENINTQNPFANDAMVFSQTPFRETIKLEADMMIAGPIDHWWQLFRHRDVVISTGCRNWRGDVSTARHYRKVFDDNQLPDVYNAITYWRLSSTAKEFFGLTRAIFDNWSEFKKLIKFPPESVDTDLVYAMAAQIMGPEQVTMPFADYPQIVHMKRHHAGTQTERWTHELVWELDPLRINTIAQWGAFHYNIKEWRYE
jgi:hypothetical protein